MHEAIAERKIAVRFLWGHLYCLRWLLPTRNIGWCWLWIQHHLLFWSIIILFHLWIIWIVLRDLSNLFCITAKGCRANWFRQSGGTPEVVGSIPGRGEFPPPVKKTPSPGSCPKHCGARPNSQGDGPRVRVGQGFGGFLGLLWEGHSTSQIMPWGRSYPPQVKFFLFNENWWRIS